MSADLERDLREMLQRTAGEVEWTPVPTRSLVRRARVRRITVASMAVIVLIAVAGTVPLAQRWIDATRVDLAPISPGPDAPPTAARHAFGPSGPELAYGADGDVYVADRNGANAVRIADGATPDPADCDEAERRHSFLVNGTAWSPDGQYLAYWDWRPCPAPANQWGQVLISDPEGNVVATLPGQGWLISWSPDSSRIAVWDSWAPWAAHIAGGHERITEDVTDSTIGVFRPNGEREAALTLPAELLPSGDVSPAWSRDGSSILVPGAQVPLDGRAPRAAQSSSSEVFSPDGTRAAYTNNKGSLVVAEADGPADQQVANVEFWDTSWSPNGDQVAYISVKHSDEFDAEGVPVVVSSELRVRDVATGSETALVKASAAEELRVFEFSPDGERILYSRGAKDADWGRGTLWSVNADGSEPRRLVDRIEWADWRPSPTD